MLRQQTAPLLAPCLNIKAIPDLIQGVSQRPTLFVGTSSFAVAILQRSLAAKNHFL